MTFKSLLIKSILKTIAISSIGLTSGLSLSEGTKAETFNMNACPESGSTNANLNYIQNTLQGECLHTPEQYKLTIYEMGLCTTDPTSSGHFDKTNCSETLISSSGTEVDLAPGSSTSKTAALPSASTRPANASYTHAYILLGNGFKMKGSYQLADGTTYYSKQETDEWGTFGAAKTNISASQEHIDLVDNMYFGDDENGWDGVMTPTDMPGGGKVSALLLKECVNSANSSLDTCTGSDGLATSQGQVKRLLGVFETNSGSPVVITDDTNGIEVELVVKSDPSNPSNSGGGYLIYGYDGDGPGPDPWDIKGFGSAPFKPKFTQF